MCLFIESIRIENGVIYNLPYHNERLNRTRNVFWKDCTPINLIDYIRMPHKKGIVKCRIVYEKEIKEIVYTPYSMREIDTLRIVHSDGINYTYKSTDREELNRLYVGRGDADDVLIVRNELITDTSIANVAFYDGCEWYTPQTPLLKGTQRAFLLDRQIIKEKEITLKQLFTYSRVTLFNAMIEFGQIEFPVKKHITV
ncbi:4-amino-4-deoxychorismate lyase [Bacteroides salyersiae]|uniref:aminotransferase class IV family protein n=1 Tax=Bacteroides salyersiae TaxID=291644 RepID=UPI001898324F|nr:aminotransferase class IV family protein [Bacteroides salyersiae]MBT9874199.1 4-amino-4-deoxychorismate lyase [Bacteroides salyersiae]MCS2404221.1 aminotransferase class IV family protein [Bacteroides salyersiae]QUT76448.1 Amino-transferase class IV [Bacteroides salyersiae]